MAGLMCVIEEQVEAVRTEMQATVTRLETELSELQQSRTSLQHDSAQQLESLERLRRENAELQQRVRIVSVLFLSIMDVSLCETRDLLRCNRCLELRFVRLLCMLDISPGEITWAALTNTSKDTESEDQL